MVLFLDRCDCLIRILQELANFAPVALCVRCWSRQYRGLFAPLARAVRWRFERPFKQIARRSNASIGLPANTLLCSPPADFDRPLVDCRYSNETYIRRESPLSSIENASARSDSNDHQSAQFLRGGPQSTVDAVRPHVNRSSRRFDHAACSIVLELPVWLFAVDAHLRHGSSAASGCIAGRRRFSKATTVWFVACLLR